MTNDPVKKTIRLAAFGVVQLLVAPLCVALGTAWHPSSDDQILVDLPKNYSLYSQNLSYAKTKGLTEQEKAVQIRYYLDIARDTGDERYLGYAHTLLEGTDTQRIQSEDLLLSYAALLQRGHRFEEALALLDKVLQAQPLQAQANLMAAYVSVTIGQPEQAKQFCKNIETSLGAIMSLNCSISANMLLGDVDRSYKVLSGLLERSHMSEVEREETLINLAEISKLRGDYPSSEKYFKQVLDKSPDNSFVLTRLADTYLAAQRFDECIKLLQNKTQPALLLRSAVAAVSKGEKLPASAKEALDNYFEVQLAREPELSSRDYALYLLVIQSQAQEALKISLKNWQLQKEVADTYLVLRAAWQADQLSEALPVVGWVEKMGLQDQEINQLLALFGEK